MAQFFKRLFGRPGLPRALTYEDARAVLESHERRSKEELAGRTDVEPEMLYYLAEHGSDGARRLVAANPSTPPEADRFLADDVDAEVRGELAHKIGRLLPDLLKSERDRVCELTLETLQRLATDQLPRVRAILSEEIKRLDCVPKSIIEALARDAEESVSAPILEYSPLLADNDLLEIIASARPERAFGGGPPAWFERNRFRRHRRVAGYPLGGGASRQSRCADPRGHDGKDHRPRGIHFAVA